MPDGMGEGASPRAGTPDSRLLNGAASSSRVDDAVSLHISSATKYCPSSDMIRHFTAVWQDLYRPSRWIP